jgi:hypothetical protein
LKVLAFTLFGMVNRFFRWYHDSGSLSKEDVAQNVISIVFNGILNNSKKDDQDIEKVAVGFDHRSPR